MNSGASTAVISPLVIPVHTRRSCRLRSHFQGCATTPTETRSNSIRPGRDVAEDGPKLRQNGATWAQIAHSLNVSPRSAHERFSKVTG